MNLSTYNPWPRPVAVAALAGLLTGLSRRGSVRTAAIAGSVAACVSLLIAYLGVRISVPVLWVGRSPARVIVADCLRLIAYGVVPGALAGGGGRRLRAALRAARNRRAAAKPPIRHL